MPWRCCFVSTVSSSTLNCSPAINWKMQTHWEEWLRLLCNRARLASYRRHVPEIWSTNNCTPPQHRTAQKGQIDINFFNTFRSATAPICILESGEGSDKWVTVRASSACSVLSWVHDYWTSGNHADDCLYILQWQVNYTTRKPSAVWQ